MDGKQIEESVCAAIEEFAKNPFWMEKIQNAPYGAVCRMCLNFWYSENKDKPEFDINDYREMREFVEESLTREDLEYLVREDDNEEARKHYQELLGKLGDAPHQEMQPPAEQGQQGGQQEQQAQPQQQAQ